MIGSTKLHKGLILIAGLVLIGNYALPRVHAATTDCNFTMSPNSVTPASDNFGVFSLTNNSASAITSVVFNSPDSQQFTVLSSSAYRWQSTNTSAQANFTGGSLNPGQSLNFTVEFSAGGTPTNAPLQWTAQASDDPTGASPTTCSGDGSISIASQPSVISISGVGITVIADHEATVEWTTDIPSTSQIQYGRRADYGQATALDTTQVTNHVVVIKNLQASAIYHYQVSSQQDADNAMLKGAVKYIVKSEHDPKEVADMVKEILAGYTRSEIPHTS